MTRTTTSIWSHRFLFRFGAAIALLTTAFAVQPGESLGADSAGDDPYSTAVAVDVNPAPDIFETTIVAKTVTRDIGGDVMANMWTYNGTVPGPRIDVEVGQTVIVNFRNELPLASGIHWHGIELNNGSDGTTLTQNGVPPGGTFLYRFVVPRPGTFWYHPHHRPTNQAFRGMYGALVVPDPHEETLVAHGVLPPPERTKTVVLSDATICKNPGTNDTDTYDDSLPWAGGGPLPEQRQPYPSTLCDTPVDDNANPIVDQNGRPVPLKKGDIPNIQRFGLASFGRTNEGQTVLANGRNTGGRGGSPEAPGEVAAGATSMELAAGQGLRIQAINAATVRYFRLRLTDSTGKQIPLVRIGGEGGLLDAARTEGGRIPGQGITETAPYDTKYGAGELLLAPSDRSDFVIGVPADTPPGTATLWTLDYLRTGEDYPHIPTVPVMHFDITAPTGTPYSIAHGTPLRTHPAVNDPVERLGSEPALLPDILGGGEFDPLLDPATFQPAKPGTADENIRLTTGATTNGPQIDGVEGTHDAGDAPYTQRPHTASTRYAKVGDLLELTVQNQTAAHHAFHFHGFSFQPLLLEGGTGEPTYTFDYHEFVDTIDIPRGQTLTFRVRLDERPLMDGTTPGGAYGRWVFHCHIFFHSTHGMHAELVVVGADGNERPTVDTDSTNVVVQEGDTATATGRFGDPDGDAVTLAASVGTVADVGGGRWAWSYSTSEGPPPGRMVYVTATDARGLRSQIAFAVTLGNVAPTVAVTAPAPSAAYAVGSTVTVTAAVADRSAGPLTCAFDWDGAADVTTPVAVEGGTCSQSIVAGRAGGFTVVVTASDGDGGTGSDSRLFVVYDTSAGSVSGSGTIESPPSGVAEFEVVAKYHKGADTPTGALSFSVGGFALRATGYRWLVVAGPKAQVRGVGTVGGVPGYEFLLTVGDGAGTGGPDVLRLKVWRSADGSVVYDNVPGSPDDIDTAQPQPITTGNIVVHRA